MDSFARQTPTGAEVYLDHVGWFIPDIDRASADFERLGFRLTPFVVSRNADPAGGPPVPSGTGNRCAMLERGYLELITAIDGIDTPLARQHRAAVSRRVGVHVVAFTVADASAARARLAREGFDPGEPVRLRRPVLAPDDRETFAAFSVVRVPPEKMPEGRIQILTQETPDLVWQDRFLTRENGLTALTGALLSVEDPGEVSARFGRFVGRAPAGGGDLFTITLDRGRLDFATPARCASLLPGVPLPGPAATVALRFLAPDRVATHRFLTGRGIRVVEDGGVLRIGPQDALGAALLIHGPDA